MPRLRPSANLTYDRFLSGKDPDNKISVMFLPKPRLRKLHASHTSSLSTFPTPDRKKGIRALGRLCSGQTLGIDTRRVISSAI